MDRDIVERGRYFALIQDLAVADPRVYWSDFLASILTFYTGFWVLVLCPLPWYGRIPLFTACSVLAFRCAAFLHEIVHQGPDRLRGFGTAYNLFFGYVFKLPTFLYTPHLEHHSTRVFSTETDPEYTIWSSRPILDIARYTLVSVFLFPGILMFRLGILPIFMPFIGGKNRAMIYRKVSTLGSNLNFSRKMRSAAEWGQIRRQESMCVVYNTSFFLLTAFGFLPWKAFFTWYALTGTAMAINFFRGLINHGYAHEGEAVSLEAMILDSTNVTGNSAWSLFWSPLNTRYHALHHLYPSIPYHALSKVHRRLMTGLPAGHPYRMTNKSTYFQAFQELVWTRRCSSSERVCPHEETEAGFE